MSLLHCPAGLCERMLVAIQQRTSRGVCGLLSGNIAGSAMIKFDCHNAQIRQACVQWLHAFSNVPSVLWPRSLSAETMLLCGST